MQYTRCDMYAACSKLLQFFEYRVAYRHAYIMTYTVTLTIKHRMIKKTRFDLTILSDTSSSNRMKYIKTLNISQKFSLHFSLLASQFEKLQFKIEFYISFDILFDIIFDIISNFLLTLYLIYHLIDVSYLQCLLNAHSIKSEKLFVEF